MTDDRQRLGAAGERVAESFLRRLRYTIVARNYRTPSGEIDLIALDGPTVVFVEVKTRTGTDHGSPFDAVSRYKQRQMTRVAQRFLASRRLLERPARFDVVGIWWNDGEPRCELIRNAFDAC